MLDRVLEKCAKPEDMIDDQEDYTPEQKAKLFKMFGSTGGTSK